jgi:hypothetical protein
MEVGKTWREIKRLANNQARWRRFTDALCSRVNDRNMMMMLVVVAAMMMI